MTVGLYFLSARHNVLNFSPFSSCLMNGSPSTLSRMAYPFSISNRRRAFSSDSSAPAFLHKVTSIFDLCGASQPTNIIDIKKAVIRIANCLMFLFIFFLPNVAGVDRAVFSARSYFQVGTSLSVSFILSGLTRRPLQLGGQRAYSEVCLSAFIWLPS